MNKVYLAGPMEGCNWQESEVWRNRATYLLGKENVFNPALRKYENNLVEFISLVEDDKSEISQSSILLANCWKKSVGTSMEILYAWEKDIYVVTICETKNIDPWLKYHSNEIWSNLHDGIKSVVDYRNKLMELV